MFNKNLITLFLALICFHTINAYTDVSMKKEDVLKLDAKFSSNSTCPEYAINDAQHVFDYCHYNFYCLGDDCYSTKMFDAAGTVNVKNEDGQVKTLGISRICNTNDECLSNVCTNGRCDNSGITQCTVPFSSELEKTKVHCGKLVQVKCESNDECASNDCSHGVCQIVALKEAVKAIKTVLYVIGAIIILAVVCCVAICFFCCCRRKKEDPMV